MFHEFAVEPSVLSSWDRTRFFLDAFGPWKGRFLARFPKHWKRMVFESLRCPEVERLRIVERLASLDQRVFSPRTHAAYDPSQVWLENARIEHGRLRFRAIIAEGGGGGDVLDAGAVDDRSELWRVEQGRMVPRQATAYVNVLELLIRASSKIIYVSPYFRADHPDKTAPVVAICAALAGSAVNFEIHFKDEPRSYAFSMDVAKRYLPRLLPPGSKVTLRCWKERSDGARLHNRYLLTDVGGVQFGDEIEVGAPGHEDRMSILDEPSRVRLWNHHTGTPAGFDAAGPAQEFVGGSR
jgi:hypothetical protein